MATSRIVPRAGCTPLEAAVLPITLKVRALVLKPQFERKTHVPFTKMVKKLSSAVKAMKYVSPGVNTAVDLWKYGRKDSLPPMSAFQKPSSPVATQIRRW